MKFFLGYFFYIFCGSTGSVYSFYMYIQVSDQIWMDLVELLHLACKRYCKFGKIVFIYNNFYEARII